MKNIALIILFLTIPIFSFDGKDIIPLKNLNVNYDTLSQKQVTTRVLYDDKYEKLGKFHTAAGIHTTILASISMGFSIVSLIIWNDYPELVIPTSIDLAISTSVLVFGIMEIRLGSSLKSKSIVPTIGETP